MLRQRVNRNVESHFALNPTRIDLSRSTFDRSASVKTSFNAGDIVSGTPKVNGIVSTDISNYMTKAIANCVYHCMGQHEVGFAYSYSNVKDQCLTHEETFNLLIDSNNILFN